MTNGKRHPIFSSDVSCLCAYVLSLGGYEYDASQLVWIKDYAEIHNNRRKIVQMYYPIFCYNGQFRRGSDGTPLTYIPHGHIHKSANQELVDRFCVETRATMRKSAHQEEVQPIPCQMLNCFCM